MAEQTPPEQNTHVLLLPYPAQGHINPLLELGKRLAARGLRATIAATRSVAGALAQPETRTPVRVALVSDGHDGGGFKEAESIRAYLDGFKAAGSRTLGDLIREEAARGRPVRCLVYDAFMPWALDVARAAGVLGAAFFSQSCAVNAIYHHVHRGRLPLPVPGTTISLEGLRRLSLEEAPSFVSVPGEYPAHLELLVNQFCNLEKADVVLVNTFDQLEAPEAEWMASLFPIKTVGPTVPSLHGDLPGEEKHYGLDLYSSDGNSCIEWLDKQDEPGSVVYVSFGSLATPSREMTEELAWGLIEAGKPFLWVVRTEGDSDSKLPPPFAAAAAGKGLVVKWCPQLEVLAHPAVGCFVTHCGWNSTLEALSMGVPMVALPQWSDQPTNAKYVEEVWGTGVRAAADGGGMVRRGELASRIKEVMDGEKGREMRKNAQKWRKLAAAAVADGGSSDRNTKEFINLAVAAAQT